MYPLERDLSFVVRSLDEAGIPNAVWGCLNVTYFAIPIVPDEVQIIVPDHLLRPAFATIESVGFTPCSNHDDCPVLRGILGEPMAEKHYHSRDNTYGETVSALAKSDTLWDLPDPPLGPPAPDDRHFMLVNDPQVIPTYCRSPWPSEQYPFRILTPLALVESSILLLCRDFDHCNRYDGMWDMFLIRLAGIMPSTGYFENHDLRPLFQPFWSTILRDPKRNFAIFKDLRQQLLDRNELPPPPPYNSFGSKERAERVGRYVT